MFNLPSFVPSRYKYPMQPTSASLKISKKWIIEPISKVCSATDADIGAASSSAFTEKSSMYLSGYTSGFSARLPRLTPNLSILAANRLLRWVLVFFTLLVSGCAAGSGDKGQLVSVPDKIKDKIGPYQIQSISDKSIAELKKAPTLFTVDATQGKATFDRMLFFFQNYCSAYSPQNIHSDTKNILISNSTSKDQVLYKVQREVRSLDIKYSVSAADKTNPSNSAIRAANLARFISDGQLDMQLISTKK